MNKSVNSYKYVYKEQSYVLLTYDLFSFGNIIRWIVSTLKKHNFNTSLAKLVYWHFIW